MTATKREIKTATNKQAILRTLLSKLDSREFDEIKISELCAAASISQASFYNYFPHKNDILVYYIQLWLVEVYWSNSVVKKKIGLKAIEGLFDNVAEVCTLRPRLMKEIISLQVKSNKILGNSSLSDADKLVAFPDWENVESINIVSLSGLLSLSVQQAIDEKELPANSNLTNVITALSAIFYSVPIIYNRASESEIKEAFRNQLNLFINGAVNISN
ncbi:hypothetical protein RJ45_22730 [Photobacterium gaetbulicola]|uniref:HTH tetR-type domain-containing protein n=1 Tax=Photobacterium gaetbulicola TaxID=1295392 RepID=A0A0B9GXT1_9GAMM|nr:TetR/AcrR family transcriptional regulator [Photobacterium gaetbulicola]KHT61472.1 hypothetical protein RJ45_22730 [Photobacterium gaetbulicola]